MLKQKIYPTLTKFDIINSEMPEVFLDPTASVKIYLYRTDQEFESMFMDEESKEQRIVNFSLDRTIDVWLGQNLTKQINPYQGASAAKTIAMAAELELYTLLDLQDKIDKSLYFFTFKPVVSKEDIKSEPKYLIKESVANYDKTKFRFAKVKAWRLSSTLIKNFQYWYFNKSAGISRTKIQKLTIEVDSSCALGGVRINGSNVLGANPQQIDYKVTNIIHPFEALEPIAVNFSYQNGTLYTQFIHWDCLGEAIIKLRNHYYVVDGGTNEYNVYDWSKYSFGLWNELAGAIQNPDAPTGSQIGLADMYCYEMKQNEASADLKAYFWGKETYGWGPQREYWNLKKCSPVNNTEKIGQFIKQSNPIFNFDCWWSGYDDTTLGPQFFSATYRTLTQESFEISDKLVKNLKDAQQYCWVLMGRMDFMDPGPLSRRFNGRNSWTNNAYYTWGVLPWGFNKVDRIQQIWNNIRNDKGLNKIKLFIEFDNPIYLNSIEVDSLFTDSITTTVTDVNNISTSYDNYSSFYLIGQDSVHTKLSFI